jgi:glycosyltransferase involved in cell wall biosynthesis
MAPALRRPLKILFVSPYLPSPPQFGGARRVHGLMTGLAEQQHTVSCAAFLNMGKDELKFHDESIRATSAYCKEVITVPNQPFGYQGRPKRTLQLRSLASLRSFEWATHVDPAFTAKLRELLARETFDVITFEFSHMAPYRREIADVARGAVFVLDEHNIEYEILRRTAASESGVVRRVYNAVNWRKLRAEELDAWRTFHGCSVTSLHDRDLLLRDLPGAKVAVVPNAVDLEYFRARPEASPVEPQTILFFGAINYFPNSDGLKFFLDEIFPAVKARMPGAKLRVVGHTPPQLLALANESIEMKGFVPDLRTEIERAAVVIAPLRIGGGTRLKILEAMAMAKPVVSTPQGAEGLEVTHERELLLADTPAGFAEQLVRLLGDPALAARLSAGARKLVEQRYGWGASVSRLLQLYDELGAGTLTR